MNPFELITPELLRRSWKKMRKLEVVGVAQRTDSCPLALAIYEVAGQCNIQITDLRVGAAIVDYNDGIWHSAVTPRWARDFIYSVDASHARKFATIRAREALAIINEVAPDDGSTVAP